jgi:hypothetical protein
MSIFDNKICTFYKCVNSEKGQPLPHPGKHVPLLDLLTNEGYTNHKLLDQLRANGYDSEYYKKNKRNLSAACFSSVQDDLIYSRSDVNHLYHTGFISFDIDHKDNPVLLHGGADEMKDFIIENIPYVAYLGKSVSNIGFWGLFPIQFKDEHAGHYEAMKMYFEERNIKIDHTSDISRLRFLAYDPDAHFELNPEVFSLTHSPNTEIPSLDDYERKNLTDDFFIAACRWVEAKHDLKFQSGMIHNYLLRLYAILRNARVSRGSALNWIYNNLIEEDQITTNCLDEVQIKRK